MKEMRSFVDSERAQAYEAKLALEIALLTVPGEHEVVLLEAASKEALRTTHKRYFESIGARALEEIELKMDYKPTGPQEKLVK